jgi:arsenical pump membrane protein
VSRRAARSLLLAGAIASLAAALAAPAKAAAAAGQAWPPFVLVAGLLLIGAVAAEEGVFAAAGAFVSRLPGGGFALLAALLLVEAAVTAVLNLDTAVVFMTPVLLHAARHRGLDEQPFLYGAVFMANSASLLLPGSNLTNLLVLSREHVPGHVFATRMLASWLLAVASTIVVLCVVYRHSLRKSFRPDVEHPRLRLGPGGIGALAAAALVLVLDKPALPVLGLGLAVAVLGRLRPRAAYDAVNPPLLVGVLGLAVGLGALARALPGLGRLSTSAGRWESTGLGLGAALLVNNLPAAVMLSAHPPAHPRALLLGLNLGPNLLVTGSLSAVLWLQVSRAAGARPSIVRYTILGAVLVPIQVLAALGAVTLLTPHGF